MSESAESGKLVRKLKVPNLQQLGEVILDEHGGQVACRGMFETGVCLLDTQTGHRVRKLPDATNKYNRPVSLSGDGRTLAIAEWLEPMGQAANDSQIEIFDLTDLAAAPRKLTTRDLPWTIQLSRDGSRLLTRDVDQIAVWDVQRRERPWTQEYLGRLDYKSLYEFLSVNPRLMSADGRRVVIPRVDGSMQVLDATTGQRLCSVGGIRRGLFTGLYLAAFLVWAVLWGLVSRRRLLEPEAQKQAANPGVMGRAAAWRSTLSQIGWSLAGVCGAAIAVAVPFQTQIVASQSAMSIVLLVSLIAIGQSLRRIGTN